MSPMRVSLSALTCAGLLCGGLLSLPARAAQSYDNCTNFIDAVPAVISTQGTWCLRHDLATAVSSGEAITVAANNVTIECNDFKLGGLAAGVGTSAYGIHSDAGNTTVRNCRVRGFRIGVFLRGDASVAEDNRVESSTRAGIVTQGDGSIIRRNVVVDIGGAAAEARGIEASGPADIIDNTVAGLAPGSGNASAIGIIVFAGHGSGTVIQGNRVRTLVPSGTGNRFGIYVPNSPVAVRGNTIVMSGADASDVGVQCSSTHIIVADNVVVGWPAGAFSPGCIDGGGNGS